MPDIELRRLNEQASHPHSMIARAETAYTAAMRYVAQEVLSRECHLLLLAGPSSSGKTTSANLLAERIRSRGVEARVISLDDFYRHPDDPAYPMKDGKQDYECVEALRIPRIHQTIEAILKGQDTRIPRFDFREQRVIEDATVLPASKGGVFILEGLHALNPILTAGLPEMGVYRLFVSVSTNITEDGVRILSGRKLRFVRRMVRDSIFRATPAERTMALWQDVLHGEDLYLYPYKETADFKLNTFHAYEPCVLAARAMRLLSETDAGGDYVDTVRRALPKFAPIAEEAVPKASLLREFLSGGTFEALY